MTSPKVSKEAIHYDVKPDILNLYTDAGLTLVPCAGFGKAFERAGLLNTLYDPNLTLKNCNYRVLLRNRYLVIDVDPRNFSEPGDKPLLRLCTDIGVDYKTMQDTFIVRSPSGGLHFYYSKHERINCRATVKEYRGLDFLSHHVTAAGSWNPDKNKHYEIARKSPLQISPAPDELLAFLTREEGVDVVAAGLMNNHPANLAKYIDYLSNCTPAIEKQNGNNQTFKVAALGKDLLIDRDVCMRLMLEYFNPRCQPPWEEDALKDIIKNAYEYGHKPAGVLSIENDFKDVPAQVPEKIILQVGKNKEPKLNIANTLTLLTKYSSSLFRENLRLNQFTYSIEFIKDPPWYTTGKQWTDDDAVQTTAYLSMYKHWDVNTAMIHQAAIVIASQRSYHPVRQYLEGLVWDGKPRINSWLHDICGAKLTDYTMFVGRKWLIGAVSRVMRPGCKFDHALILVGDQGTGKSLLCRTLGEPWFTDASLDIRNKDSVEILKGNWIVELSEMDVLTRAETRALKGFVSRQVDRMRPAYARETKDYPRQCVFIGTINPEAEGFLRDPTGNRRWWPVEVGKMNIALLRSCKDQLWAEAFAMTRKGEPCHVESAQIALMTARETARFEQEDPWFAIVRDWISTHEYSYYDSEAYEFKIKIIDIYGQCLGGNVATIKASDAVRIATILKQLGYHKSTGRMLDSYYRKNISESL